MTYPGTIALTVTAAGSALTDYIQFGQTEIKDIINKRINTCKFTLINPPYIPQDMDELIVLDGATRLFAGFVQEIDERYVGLTGNGYKITATDYTILLDKAFAKDEYEGKTDAFILNDIFTDNLPEIDTSTYVTAVETYDRVRFNRKSLYSIVDRLAEEAGASWYVDYNKNLHFFLGEENAAPYGISDTPDFVTTFPCKRLKKIKDASTVFNRVEIVGGDYRSDDQEFILPGFGQDTRADMPFKMQAPDGETAIQVWRNDGNEGTPVWTPMNVLVGYIDTAVGTTDVLHYFQEKVLEQADVWPNLPNAIKIASQYDVPLRARVRDDTSHAFYGRWMDTVVKDDNIVTKSEAQTIGKAMLVKDSIAQNAYECTVFEPGLMASQMINLVDSNFAVTADLLIHRATTFINRNKDVEIDLEMGLYNPDLIDTLAALARASEADIPWNDDEVLDDLLMRTDDLALSETTAAPGTSAQPYVWGTAATNVMVWDYFTWA